MTEEQRHSAAGSMAGMMYQVYYFLKQLLLLHQESRLLWNKIGFVSPARRYEAPTVVRPPQ